MLFLTGNNAGRFPQDGNPINCLYLKLESIDAGDVEERSVTIHAQVMARSLGCIGCGGQVQVACSSDKQEVTPPRSCPLFGLEYRHR